MAELLAPAGNVESLDAAIGEGADAVYLGLKTFNARLRSSNFSFREFEGALSSLHKKGKKLYVTVNTVCEERETERLYRFLSYLNRVGPDGLIVQDYGVIRMCQEFFPNLVLHASTQMNVESASAANLLGKEGFKRVVLARELGLEEIQDIKAKTNVELEVFVHGALCVSESGLCLFSSFLGGKSANRGMCAQACRRLYTSESGGGNFSGYYFSPCDLQLIDKIPDLVQAGVESFKIEGRMKSAEYVGSVVAAYRYVLDHWQENKKEAVAAAKRMLATDFARSKTSYWYNFKTVQDGVEGAGSQILNPNQAGGTGIYLGKIASVKSAPSEIQDAAKAAAEKSGGQKDYRIQLALLKGGSYNPDPGDSIRIHKKNDAGRSSHKVRHTEFDDQGRFWLDVPMGFGDGDEVYLLQTKSMSKRYPRVLPNDLAPFNHQPRDELLPVMDLTPVQKKELDYFPEGIYVQVSSIADVFAAQALNPVRLILELNKETLGDLLNKKTVLPFSKKQIILSLDPFCPQGIEERQDEQIGALVEMGYKTFVANNLAQIPMLRQKDAKAIAGPYLYTFNRWAVSWLENQNIGAFVSPYENSKKNLEAVFDPKFRERLLLPVYAYPALFRMRFMLPKEYDFTYFSDKEEVNFKVNSTADGSFVMPEVPFSIADKTSDLQSLGFRRFLIDFSKTKVQRQEVKAVQQSMAKQKPLEGVSRFNWKEGFYSISPEEYRAKFDASGDDNWRSKNQPPRSGKGRKFQNAQGPSARGYYSPRGKGKKRR
ncbi:MAG: U32 family peptidase [Treponema sp.]|nr:U32 family peptidase [Treponema sp.]